MSVIEKPTETKIQVLDPKVEAGAAVLDEIYPGWADKINLDTLDVDRAQFCVLAQVYSGSDSVTGSAFLHGLNVLDKKGYACRSGELGFHTNIPCLTPDWRLAIQARKTR